MQYKYNDARPFWLNHALATISTNDLDPVYVGVWKASEDLGESAIHRFLLAMLCYYHLGVACQIVDESTDKTFYDVLQSKYKTAKRGTERRHFRGANGLKCLEYLSTYSTASEFIQEKYRPKYSSLIEAFEDVPAFGPYFIWKVQDFYDRILSMSIDPDTCNQHIPKESLKGLELVRREMIARGRTRFSRMSSSEVMGYVVDRLRQARITAPPVHERLVDIREAETCMCMLRHYRNNTDYVGKDLEDKRGALIGYGHTASIVLSYMPSCVPREFFSPPKYVSDDWIVQTNSST